MKIIHLLQSNSFSGAENVVCQIIGMMKNQKDIKMVYCSSDGPIREALEERNIKFIPLEQFSVKAIKKMIRKENPDMIHAHDMRASLFAALACGKIPLISHIHNNAFDSRGLSAKSLAYCYAAIKAKHIFWVSQSSFDGYAFHKSFALKSTVLYNIIDIDALYDKMQRDENEYSYDIVYVGRLTYPKNPQRLMNVFRLVKEKAPCVRIAVIGTGDLDEETKAVANEYGLDGNIEFLGFISNPLKILHDSKVMVMTSRWEGTPMCALESLSLGVPIVSTPVDGLKELVIADQTGYLSDSDEELSDHLVRIVQDKQLHARLSDACKMFAREMNDKEAYVNSLLKVIRQ